LLVVALVVVSVVSLAKNYKWFER